MPRPRIDMRKIREVLRLALGEELSRRQVAAASGVPLTTVNDYLRRAAAADLKWPLPGDLEDAGLEALLYPPAAPSVVTRPVPDWQRVHKELRRKGVTLQLLWVEYREAHPDGYGYSQFANLYRAWRGQVDVTMRQSHVAGEKLFVDFPGDTVPSGTAARARSRCGPSCSSPCWAPRITCTPRRSRPRSCCTG